MSPVGPLSGLTNLSSERLDYIIREVDLSSEKKNGRDIVPRTFEAIFATVTQLTTEGNPEDTRLKAPWHCIPVIPLQLVQGALLGARCTLGLPGRLYLNQFQVPPVDC